MNPEEIELTNLAKIFEYEKLSREVDSCNDLNQLKDIAKSYIKLHFKFQETLTSMNFKDL
jgi:hemerythrin